ncbi:heterokaryon incompatibility protein-domain-containing protein [Xylaria sp. FL0933]|nr:heterokaryon incompatibility protein-domain-containing protein [Xylaria sp. FL0933]
MDSSVVQLKTVVDEDVVVKVSRQASVRVSEYCAETPYLALKVPDEIDEVVRVSFTTFAHDQGWASDTGRGSWTWFETFTTSPKSSSSWLHLNKLKRALHHNVVANPNSHRIQTIVHIDNPEDREWLANFKGGDSIQLVPRAMYPGWVNFVEEAEIEILGRLKTGGPIPLVRKIGTGSSSAYRKLQQEVDEIRILHLHPAARDAEIMCSLKYATLESEMVPQFEAMSYCWGDQTQRKTIKLIEDGTDGDGTVRTELTVTENLYLMLKALRNVETIRVLWVDAICINQQDIDERSQQVSLMHQVYSKADRVVIWLGDANPPHLECFGLWDKIGRLLASDPDSFKSQVDSLDKPHSHETFISDYAVIAAIFELFWFSRVWVVQEAYYARSCIVKRGPQEFSWAMVLRVNECLKRARQMAPGLVYRLMPNVTSRLFRVGHANGELAVTKVHDFDQLAVIVAAIDLSCSDPRDKIFGIRHLVTDDDGLQADYGKPILDVFADLTRHWIRKSRSLRILSAIHADFGRSWHRMIMAAADLPSLGHPSWSFWYTGSSGWANTTLGFAAECKHRASGTTEPDHKLLLDSVDARELRLFGVRIGVIAEIIPFGSHGMREIDPAVCQQTINTFEEIFDPWGKDLSWKPSYTNPNFVPIHEKVEAARDVHPHIHMEGRSLGSNEAIMSCLSDSLFLTEAENGIRQVGLCPHTAQIGDLVVVLLGGNVPFILRPAHRVSDQSRGKMYYLVGEAYCQGYMNGRATEEMESDISKREIFTLI